MPYKLFTMILIRAIYCPPGINKSCPTTFLKKHIYFKSFFSFFFFCQFFFMTSTTERIQDELNLKKKWRNECKYRYIIINVYMHEILVQYYIRHYIKQHSEIMDQTLCFILG